MRANTAWRSTGTRVLWAWLVLMAAYVTPVLLGTTIAVLLIPAFSGAVIVRAVLAERSIHALLTKGEAGRAIVIETRDGAVVTLRYWYSTPRGTFVSPASLPSACVLQTRFVPVEGDEVFVAFDPNDPRRNVVCGGSGRGWGRVQERRTWAAPFRGSGRYRTSSGSATAI